MITLLRVGSSIADALGDIKPRPLVAASGGGGIGGGFGAVSLMAFDNKYEHEHENVSSN